MASIVVGPAKDHMDQLCRFQSLAIHTSRLLAGWLPGIERWEVKHAVGLHLWEDAQHSRAIRTRLWELRLPNPDAGVEATVQRVIHLLAHAQHDYELLAGVYLGLKTELVTALKTYLTTTHPILDAPSFPVLRQIIPELDAQIAWATQTVAALADTGEKTRQARRWTQYARDLLAAIGGVAGPGDATTFLAPPPGYSLRLPFPQAHRDSRFDLRLSLTPPATDDRLDQTVWQFTNYAMEMQAAETIGSVMWEVEGMPWEFYYDLARHGMDEVRHSKLGETRLAELGYHITDFPHSVANYAWRQRVDPALRYCILTYVIEADSFDLKHTRYQDHLAHGDMDSAQAILYDILDETMHVRFGHKWTPPLLKHYGYDRPLYEIVKECRAITLKHTVSPEQRAAAQQKMIA